ncbi:endonuclease domain-containing protein [Corynebacterium pelargi]|uniref:Uncharacterized protein n=1 Tax=Corynebacterium pelargi TaxID=1471400 RepID=A0A410WBN4_9CORY|nr:DUF559 domain-containing protein [Corynebacterium pelargi]QAU53362.1 hypothetical protein CPELA_10580 [Corynebacterium pelargi]GGG73013.1 hypothetical protein GCM10007338_07730 [Corynebacterium pelargi]
MSRRTLSTLLKNGELVRVFRGHYSRGRPSIETLIQWLQQHKPFAVLTGITAQEHHEQRPLSLPLHIEVPRGKALINNEYFRMRHSRNLPDKSSTSAPFASALETARVLKTAFTTTERRDFLARAYPGREGLQNCLHDSTHTPRLGPQLKQDLKHAPIGCDSNTERRFFATLANMGLTMRHNKPIGPYRFDAVCEKAKLIIEIDGYTYHNSEEQFIIDRWKSNAAQLHGYTILRYSAACIDTQFDTCIDQVMRATQPHLPTHQHEAPETTGAWRWHSKLRQLQWQHPRPRT